MESRFRHFVFCCGVHSSGRVWCILFSRHVWLCVCWLCDPLGVGRQALRPSRPAGLLLHEPWLLRRKRDCTPALFLTSSLCSSCNVAAFFGGGRIGTSPFLLTMSRSSPEEEGQAHLLTNPASTSEGEGQAFSLTLTVRTTTTRWLRSAG